MKLLIGYDGSACADEALRDLLRAALPRHVEALVLSVADMWPVLPDPRQELEDTELPSDQARSWEEQIAAAEGEYLPAAVRKARQFALQHMEDVRSQAEAGARRVRELFPDWEVRSDVVADSPYWALTKRAERWGADLVLVGSHGRSTLGRLMLGSVSAGVVSHTRCSVRVASCGPAPRQGPPRLVVGVDGTRDSELAVEAVAGRNWPENSSVRIVAVSEPKALTFFAARFRRGFVGPGSSEEDHNAWLLAAAEDAAAQLTAAGLAAEVRFLEGDPKRTLLEEAESSDADCIFLGAKGQGGVKDILLGTVATAVVSRAPCTVEVVRQKGAA